MKSLHINPFVRWWLALFAVLALASCGGDDNDDVSSAAATDAVISANGSLPENVFTAILTSAQEVPPVPSTATGSSAVLIDPVSRLMRATIITTGINGIAAHIHLGAPGEIGPIVFPMTETLPGSGIWTTQTTISDAQIGVFRAGNYYSNVHSPTFPNGEIRGQLLPQLPASSTNITPPNGITSTTPVLTPPLFFANIATGAQVIPPTPSEGFGVGLVIVDPVTSNMTAALITLRVAGVAANIHEAQAGFNGPPVFPLTESAPANGIWTTSTVLTGTQIGTIQTGGYYFNVPSAAFPAGEIRGQIVRTAGVGVNGIGAGTTGATGTIGASGVSGVTSATGTTGATGATGTTDTTGTTNTIGTSAATDTTGAAGTTGAIGATAIGVSGTTGAAAIPGTTGIGGTGVTGIGVPAPSGIGGSGTTTTGIPVTTGIGGTGATGIGIPAPSGIGGSGTTSTGIPLTTTGTGISAISNTGIPAATGIGGSGVTSTGIPLTTGIGTSGISSTGIPGPTAVGTSGTTGFGTAGMPGISGIDISGTTVPGSVGTTRIGIFDIP